MGWSDWRRGRALFVIGHSQTIVEKRSAGLEARLERFQRSAGSLVRGHSHSSSHPESNKLVTLAYLLLSTLSWVGLLSRANLKNYFTFQILREADLAHCLTHLGTFYSYFIHSARVMTNFIFWPRFREVCWHSIIRDWLKHAWVVYELKYKVQ